MKKLLMCCITLVSTLVFSAAYPNLASQPLGTGGLQATPPTSANISPNTMCTKFAQDPNFRNIFRSAINSMSLGSLLRQAANSSNIIGAKIFTIPDPNFPNQIAKIKVNIQCPRSYCFPDFLKKLTLNDLPQGTLPNFRQHIGNMQKWDLKSATFAPGTKLLCTFQTSHTFNLSQISKTFSTPNTFAASQTIYYFLNAEIQTVH